MNFANVFFSLALVGALLLLGCTAANNGVAKNGSPAGSDSEKMAEVTSEDLTQVTIGNINWYVKYDEAMQVAKQQNKPIWLHFGENPG